MKKILTLTGFLAAVLLTQLPGCGAKKTTGIESVKAITLAHIAAFKQYINDSFLLLAENRSGMQALQNKFIPARMLYKKTEWATEYFMGTTTRFVNGPPLPEIETEENKLTDPEGLQVIEALIYTKDSIDYPELVRQSKLILAHCTYYENYWQNLPIDSAQILDAVRLEVFRISSLGISGFDAPLALSSIDEAKSSLEAVQEILQVFDKKGTTVSLAGKAIGYLTKHNDFLSFDRLLFIKDYSDPLTRSIVALHQSADILFVKDVRLLRTDAASLFEDSAFNINAYTTDPGSYFTKAKALLGKKLFYDAVLSGNNKRSCASCHNPAKAFTDGLTTNVSLSKVNMQRNTPTLLNAALQPSQFYDLRTTTLENQSSDVIHNKDEMQGNLESALRIIIKDTAYRNLLQQAFPGERTIGSKHIQNAIASYVRSLSLLNSRFDAFMRNEKNATLSTEEKTGFNLFMGKAKCGSCHFMPLFNGTVPPGFLEMESEVIGVPGIKNKNSIDNDLGRFAIYKLEPFRYAFKTTTVRNSALTAPYMHNGVFKTLEEVVDFYNKGGGAGSGIDVPNQTLAPDSLGLNSVEKKALISFMHSLNDRY